MPGDTGHGTGTPQRRTEDATNEAQTRRPRQSRRRLLTAGGGVAATLLAGCSNVVPGDTDGNESDAADSSSDTATATGTATPTPSGETSETHVTGFQYKTDGSTRTFFVTLAPSESGADWWQLETLGGERLARTEFDSTRTDGRFTTSAEVDVDGTSAVVVRGHSVDTGYGGQVMLADLEEGRIRLEQQGTEPASFENYSF
ncbi:hypothetical protein [Halorarius litoreus]|uniref:hypothetical protein n=1 Tax=Halorarius litoreus TaxID=2962676 RepID=UPI0020CCD194|nr:hypothetical protein [Halorarius litoreus]